MLDEVKLQIERFIQDLNSKDVDTLFRELSQGKMLRSKLILKIAGYSEEAIVLSAIVELIHLASLLHDDVIDMATTRRGVESVNSQFGDKSAIMLGDILYSKAFFELTKFDSEIAKVISNSVTLLSLGELLDVNLSKNFNSSQELYFDMIYKKTASLIEASSKASAILSKRSASDFGEYGKNLGIAFQIIDDILDITQSSQKLGKPAMSDFKEGKSTLPYIILYRSLNSSDRERLISLFKRDLTLDEFSWLRVKFKENRAIESSIELAREYSNLAISKVSSERELVEIVQAMVDRDF